MEDRKRRDYKVNTKDRTKVLKLKKKKSNWSYNLFVFAILDDIEARAIKSNVTIAHA